MENDEEGEKEKPANQYTYPQLPIQKLATRPGSILDRQGGSIFDQRQQMFTTKARRIGLGLVVVKNLTQANGGRVGMESAPGKGSTFSVTLPSGS